MKSNQKAFLIEIFIIIIAAIPLLIFPSHQYSGDGGVYASSIFKNQYVWNPNHLFVQPIGLVFYNFLQSLNISIHPLDAQRIIAIISAIISILIFWIALKKYILPHKWHSAIFVIGFFYSNYFLALAESSEFLMVQMPFLMIIFLISLWFIQKLIKNDLSSGKIILIGLSLGLFNALATLCFISNIFLILGLFFAFILISIKNLTRKAIQAGIIMLFSSLFLTGCTLYVTWNSFIKPISDIPFLKWFISYGGTGNVQMGTYGISTLNITNVMLRTARMIFSFLQNIAHTELGSIVKSKLTGILLDCVGFDLIQIIWWSFIFFIIGTTFFFVLIWTIKNILKNKNLFYYSVTIFLLIWILSFLPFNFYWNNSDDQFWFQILPAFWSFLAIPLSIFYQRKESLKKTLYMSTIIIFILFIIINNIVYAVLPRYQFNTKHLAYKLSEYLPNNSVLIWPGNDRWGPVISFAKNYAEERGQLFESLSLVSLASKHPSPDSLTKTIHNFLSKGYHVFLLRIIKPDDECVPWAELREKGWSRGLLVKNVSEEFHSHMKKIYKSTTLVEIDVQDQ